jgi:hypothetical protein
MENPPLSLSARNKSLGRYTGYVIPTHITEQNIKERSSKIQIRMKKMFRIFITGGTGKEQTNC